jgi:hypothetical protein
MAKSNVVILSKQTLFAEGVASRLGQFPQRVEFQFVDPQDPDYLEAITAVHPTAVILDATEAESKDHCVLCDLLLTFPFIKVIRLAPQKDHIQVVSSVQQQLSEVRDLLDVIENP